MLTETALLITALSFPFIAITRLTSAFFYATGKNRNATFLVYLEPCCLLPLFLISFSSSFGLSGIWAAYPAAQIVLCVCALVLKSPNLETVLGKNGNGNKNTYELEKRPDDPVLPLWTAQEPVVF